MDFTISYIGDWKCFHLDSIDSTNSYAKRIIFKEHLSNFIVIADHQTHGYGQSQKNWESSNKKGLWMSLAIPIFMDIQNLSQSTLVLAVAIQRAIYQVSKLNLKIKWPNDLLSAAGKKCAGLLVENALLENNSTSINQHILVLGIGLNIEQRLDDFSEDIKKIATSLYIENNNKPDRNQLISAIIKNITFYFQKWQTHGFSEIRNEWIEHSCSIGKEIVFFSDNEKKEGVILDLFSTGEIIVSLSNGNIVHVGSSEIIFKSQTNNMSTPF